MDWWWNVNEHRKHIDVYHHFRIKSNVRLKQTMKERKKHYKKVIQTKKDVVLLNKSNFF